jgi:hypothetical protein
MLRRVLLGLALMMNGTAMPPAVATGMPPVPTHARENAPDGLPDPTLAGDPAHSPATNCRDAKASECGCTASQAHALRQTATSRASNAPPARPAAVNAPYASSLISTPFRPPA